MKRVALLVVIMTVVAASVAAVALAILFQTAFEQQRQRLVETATIQARLMEAVARFDQTYNSNYPGGARAGTIEQIREAYASHFGVVNTEEFALAKRDRDDIVFLLRHRHSQLDTPARIPFQSDLAEPMRRALSGQSGTVVGPDYRGVTVLAAYEPVYVLDLGIVAKIDLAEIQAPFLRAFGVVVAIAITLITIGTILFFRVSNPMIRAIRESEERYRAVLEDSPALICRFRPGGEITYANESYCSYFKKTAEELVGSSFLSLIPEENRKTVTADIEALTPDAPTQSHEHQVVASNGEIRWQRWTNRALFDAMGQAIAYQSIGEDITERKKAEAALSASRDLLESVVENVPIRVFWKDGELRYLGCNSVFAHDAGLTRPEELLGKDDFQMSWRNQAETYRADDRRVMELDAPYLGFEEPQTTPDGNTIWLRTSKVPLHDADGKVFGVLGIYEDITEQRRVSEALKCSEASLVEAQRIAHLGSWALDLATNTLSWSDEIYRIFEIDPDESGTSYEAFMDAIHPQDRAAVDRAYRAHLEQRVPHDIEHRLLMKDGRIKYVHERCETTYEDGQPLHSLGTVQDITERVQHEELAEYYARRAEALLQLPRAAEELDEIAFMQRGLEMAEELTESRISFLHFVNEDEQSIELITWSRRTLEEYCSATFESHYPISEAGVWADALRRYEPVVFNDYPGYAHKHGLPEGHAELTRLISLPVIEKGKVVLLAGVGNKSTDYTDLDVETLQLIADGIWRIVQRRRSLIKLQTSEARYRELVESMTDGVTVHEAVDSGQDFVIREHNRAGERITGLPREQAIGRRFTEAFPEVGAMGLLAVFRRVWLTGEAESHPTSLYKDERISLWVECYVFKLPSGEIVNVYSDVTERKQAEEALRSSHERLRLLAARLEAAREEERTAIAREVHDHFGQALTGLKMDLAWLGDHLAQVQTNSFTERLGAAEALADSTLEGMRHLAASLRPRLLDDLGLSAAIEWQVKEFADRVGCGFDLDLMDDDIELDRERDTAVYRILQEALTNIARHAQASWVQVSLQADADTLELMVADDGKGIRDEDMESVTSMGLTGMRERAAALGGQVDISSRTEGGTQLLLRVPRS